MIMHILALIFAAVVGISSVYWFGFDNPVEEIAEKVIEEEIEIEVGLTKENSR
jgi:hypothetical protein